LHGVDGTLRRFGYVVVEVAYVDPRGGHRLRRARSPTARPPRRHGHLVTARRVPVSVVPCPAARLVVFGNHGVATSTPWSRRGATVAPVFLHLEMSPTPARQHPITTGHPLHQRRRDQAGRSRSPLTDEPSANGICVPPFPPPLSFQGSGAGRVLDRSVVVVRAMFRVRVFARSSGQGADLPVCLSAAQSRSCGSRSSTCSGKAGNLRAWQQWEAFHAARRHVPVDDAVRLADGSSAARAFSSDRIFERGIDRRRCSTWAGVSSSTSHSSPPGSVVRDSNTYYGKQPLTCGAFPLWWAFVQPLTPLARVSVDLQSAAAFLSGVGLAAAVIAIIPIADGSRTAAAGLAGTRR